MKKTLFQFKTLRYFLFVFLLAAIPSFFNSCGGYESFVVDSQKSQSSESGEQDADNSSSNSENSSEPELPAKDIDESSSKGWVFIDDYNSGTLGEKTAFDAGGQSRYSDVQSLEGGMSSQMGIRAGETGYGQWGGVISHPEDLKQGDELWLRVYMYFPEGFDYYSYGEGGRLKFLRFHVQSQGGDNRGYNDIYIDQKSAPTSFKYIYEGEQRWVDVAEKSYLPKFDVWESYEFYVKFHPVSQDDGGEAVIRFWKNGKLLKEITNRKTLSSSSDVSDRTHIFTYWNGGSPKTQFMWIDNLVLTSKTPPEKDEFGNPYIGTGIYLSK